jgi:cytochrome P450
LTLLRHPAILDRLRKNPDLIPGAVEEMLRYEPPGQFISQRTPLEEITLPERRDNQHLGFGSGIHSCFGAPLARIEAQIAFTELLRRLDQPRLLVDRPPYRPSPFLRGPKHLPIEVAGVRSTEKLAAGVARK